MTTRFEPKWAEGLVEERRYLHQHPELSGEETRTAQYLYKKLQELEPTTIITQIGGHGMAAIFDSGEDGPSIMYRTELDALPIEEENEFAYRSERKTVSHKCGHDGHMTMVLGFGRYLAQHPPQRGRIILLFQPAEEIGAGAEWMLADPKFEQLLPIDYAFAIHNLPGFPLGQVVCKRGPFSAAVKSLIIRLYGKTSHAGEPENGINPALAVSEIIREADIACQPDANQPEFAILTPVHIKLGEIAYGVSAGYGEVHLTIRTWTEQEMGELSARLLRYVSKMAVRHRLRVETEWTNVFRTTRNEEEVVDIVEQAAVDNGYQTHECKHPFKWGEDFGAFTQRFRGAMFGLGAGEQQPALHNPDYDFPDELLLPGIYMYRRIMELILG
ncbi:MAG: amidohydrolase [Bacteroidetes bacterium]|jgi:amidohydrolase|nr:amidohydrolase [Bacteroidota bacterium]